MLTIFTKYSNLNLTHEQIEDIHSRDKLTPIEKVKEWESFGICTPGGTTDSGEDRCRYFVNCHECLLEYASHNTEYDKFEFKNFFPFDNKEIPVLKKTRK